MRGEDIAGLPPFLVSRRGIGYAPDDRRISPNLTTLENLIIPTHVHKKRKGHRTVDKVDNVFPPLRDLKNRKGRFLSGGEQRMLSIGRDLMFNPDLLLLDEPSEGLSPLMVRLLMQAINSIAEEGLTILVADQNLSFAHETAD